MKTCIHTKNQSSLTLMTLKIEMFFPPRFRQHYLHLHAALFGPHTDEINSVFDKAVDDLEQWQRILVKDLGTRIVDEIKAKSMSYRHDNWISMSDQNALEPFMLSMTAGEMFQVCFTFKFIALSHSKSRSETDMKKKRKNKTKIIDSIWIFIERSGDVVISLYLHNAFHRLIDI